MEVYDWIKELPNPLPILLRKTFLYVSFFYLLSFLEMKEVSSLSISETNKDETLLNFLQYGKKQTVIEGYIKLNEIHVKEWSALHGGE